MVLLNFLVEGFQNHGAHSKKALDPGLDSFRSSSLVRTCNSPLFAQKKHYGHKVSFASTENNIPLTFFFFYSLSLFLSSLNHEKCFYLQVQTFDHCKKGTFDCYLRRKLSHAYFLACATHRKSVLLFHFFFICSSLTSGLLSGLVL